VVGRYLELSESKVKGSGLDEQSEAILQAIPGIEVADGLQRSGWNVPLYIKLLRDFNRYHAEDARMLKSLLHQGDENEARRLAHTLKGAAGNIGAKQLYLSCQCVEKQIPDAITEDDLNELQLYLEQLTYGIGQLPGKLKQGKSQAVENPMPWSELMTEMVSLLKEGNVRAIDLLPSVMRYAHEKQPDLVTKLEEMVDRYSFDEALQILDQIDAVLSGEG
jgi:HPt (histidine-containing phosphotransfer) domain-containing protein